jgi:FkbM family methyltransferase
MNRIANSIISAIPSPFLEFVSRNQWRSPLLRRVCAWGASLVKGRDGVILHGIGQGLRFNVASSHSGFLLGSHETEVQKVMATLLRPGMVYYDVGANVGFFAVLAARLLGPAGRIVCFEPLPQNAEQIAYNSRLNGFTTIAVRIEALGGSNRTETFCTSAEPTWGMLNSVGKAPDQASGAIEVSVRTLDSLCGPGGLPHPNLIKIDVEGAEAEVLEGASATLAASRPVVVIELHGTNAAVLTVLDKLGYRAGVLGSAVSVREVNWDANIIAAPAERADLLPTLTAVSQGFATA